MSGPRVTVVVPAYDRADLLDETMASVAAQTFESWECVIIDDGSTDHTPSVARAWVERDPRFRYVRQENTGAGAARNHGIRLARGEFVSFVDSDDLLQPDKLAWQVDALDAEPAAVLVYGDARHFRHENPDEGYEYLARVAVKPSGDAFEDLLSCSAIYAPTVRASALEHARFDEEIPSAEDWDMWLRLAKLGRVLHEPRIALDYRLHEGGKSTNKLRNYRCARRVLERHLTDVPAERRKRRRAEALANFRIGYPPRLRREAEALTAAGDWGEARQRWLALARLSPGAVPGVRGWLHVAWAALPTRLAPPWKPLARRLRALRSPRERHRRAVDRRVESAAPSWRRRAHDLRAGGGSGPRRVVGIALVDHLGDLVAAEPVARHLRREHPDDAIVWIVRDAYRELPSAFADVDEVWTVGCLTEWIRLREDHPFDRLVDLHVRGRSCGVCQEKLERTDGDPAIDIGNYYAHGDLLQVFCRSAGLAPIESAPRLNPPAAARLAVDRLDLPEGYVVIHGRSAQAARDWDDDRWRALTARILADTDHPVVEVGLDAVVDSAAPGYVNLCGRLSILETAEVIRRAVLFIGIDSGPAHLAAAVGTRSVLLMGTYRSYERYRPWSEQFVSSGRADVLWADGAAAELSVEEVFRAVCDAMESIPA